MSATKTQSGPVSVMVQFGMSANSPLPHNTVTIRRAASGAFSAQVGCQSHDVAHWRKNGQRIIALQVVGIDGFFDEDEMIDAILDKTDRQAEGMFKKMLDKVRKEEGQNVAKVKRLYGMLMRSIEFGMRELMAAQKPVTCTKKKKG